MVILRLFMMILLTGSFNLGAQPIVSPCARHTPMRIVVLGSSTAAGAGASTADSSWVNRYRNYLQGINPKNEVINLAVGGFSTYRIMPDDFNPPAGKPLPDTLHNVTQALSHSPDAIIINLPSNDVALGFTTAEQLNNFDSLSKVISQTGTDLWVTTTQPRDFSPGNVLLQMEVRDSILAKWGSRAIDLWTGFANAAGTLDSSVNSGDGIHLNDNGHLLVFNRVRDAELPNESTDTLDAPDYSIAWINNPYPLCGDSLDSLRTEIVNLGITGIQGLTVWLRSEDLNNGTQYLSSAQIGAGIAGCTADTVIFTLNTLAGSKLKFTVWSSSADDSTHQNDTSIVLREYTGTPQLITANDTVCKGDTATLYAYALPGDTLAWFMDLSNNPPLSWGNTIHLLPPDSGILLYAQAIRGPLHFPSELITPTDPSIYWNGVMFDLIADSALIIDSLHLVAGPTGAGEVRMYIRQGSYAGYEQMAQAWILFANDTILNVGPGDECTLRHPPMAMSTGDTVGIYLMFSNAQNRLGYRSVNQVQKISSTHLKLRSGAGISHNFGTPYPNR
ncbi:MAG: SGNH/GDSL hydrolase family protein, partial [Bacteroidales bacterium]|nr:SGNH/GDSL hydrolase family protein [Bacteroidales bacterium]